MKLIRTVLLFPFYLYLGLLEKCVKICFKFIFLGIKIGEKVPVVGPLVTKGVEFVSETRIMNWILKFKQD